MYRLFSRVPTSYQFGSISSFNMPITKHFDGSYTAEMKFETIEEARQYLKSKAEIYFNDSEDLEFALESISKRNLLRIDSATAIIERVKKQK